MVIIKDNFLDQSTFDWLSETAQQHAEIGLKIANDNFDKKLLLNSSMHSKSIHSKFYTLNQPTNKKSGWDMSFGSNLKGDLVEPCIKLKKDINPVIKQIMNSVNEDISPLVLHPVDSVHMLFGTVGYKIREHIDIIYTNTTMQQLKPLFKVFLFCNKNWKSSWGGELCFKTTKCLPIPNRLVAYSRDESHWVNEVTEKAENYRIIFATSFGKETNQT